MGLITKIKSARSSKSKQRACESSSSTAGTTKKLFPMRRPKCRTPVECTDGDCTNDTKTPTTSTTRSLAFRVVSVPKEYKETNERFNWLTNELDSFEYKPSTDSIKAVKRVSEGSRVPKSDRKQTEVARENDCFGSDWLFLCWGSRPVEKDAITACTSPRSTETSDDGSGSTSEPPDNKEGEVLEAKPADDVSDITSVPSEDYSDSDEDDESSASEEPNKKVDSSSRSSLES
ncbi:hypothetical protein ACHAWX_004731 [Stephanocyclus meneghinianus]